MLSQWDGSICSCAGLNQRGSPARPACAPECPGLSGHTPKSPSCRRAAVAGCERCKDLVGKKVRVSPGSFLPQTHCKFRTNPQLVQAGFCNSTQLGIMGKYRDDLLHAWFCHSIYNFIWEGISTKCHKTWGFPLKSFSCSFMTFVQQ